MSRFVGISLVTVAILVLITTGCERKHPPEEPPSYDAQLDGGFPGPPELHVDPDLSAARAMITGRPVTFKETVERPTRVPGVSIEQAKRALGDMIAAAKGGDEQAFLAGLDEEDAETLRKILQAIKDFPGKAESFERVLQEKLGMELPDKMKDGMTRTAGMGAADVLKLLPLGSLDAYEFKQEGNEVHATGPGGATLTLVKVGRIPKVRLGAELKEPFQILGELFAANDKLMDTVTAGINNGSVTKDNFSEESDKLAKEILEPVETRLLAITLKQFAEVGPGEMKITEVGPGEMKKEAPLPPPEVKPTEPPKAEEETGAKPDDYGIVRGTTYKLPSMVMMGLGDDPHKSTGQDLLEAGTTIKIIGRDDRDPMIRYKVEATSPDGKKIGTGWIKEWELDPRTLEVVEAE